MVVLILPDTKCVPVTSTHETRLLLGRKCRLASNFFDRLSTVSGFDIWESGFVRPRLVRPNQLQPQCRSLSVLPTCVIVKVIHAIVDGRLGLAFETTCSIILSDTPKKRLGPSWSWSIPRSIYVYQTTDGDISLVPRLGTRLMVTSVVVWWSVMYTCQSGNYKFSSLIPVLSCRMYW